jgi:hypothetical protein
MDVVLRNLVGKEAWVFMDDVVIYSYSLGEHAGRLPHVFDSFMRANLQLQPEKCNFAKTKITYLGYVLSQNGIEASEELHSQLKMSELFWVCVRFIGGWCHILQTLQNH